MTVIKIVPMPGPQGNQGDPGQGGGVSSTVPFELNDTNDDLLLSITKTGTGTTRIETPQDDLSLRSARDITLYAGSDGPGKVYIGWGDAVYTPNSGNEVATLSAVDESISDALNNFGGLANVKTRIWGYPTTNAVAIAPDVDGESISLKSSQASSIRWHVRNNGFSYGSQENANLIPLTATLTSTEGGWFADFTFEEQNSVPYFGNEHYYNIYVPESSGWDGLHYAIDATTTTMRILYETEPEAFVATNASIGQPSVYSQFEVNQDGAWIKLANWSDGMGKTYSQSWQFTKEGGIHFPYQQSNSRTGYGDVLKFANSFDQSIIMGPETTESSTTANRLVIAGADGYPESYGEGGDLYLWAGQGGTAGGTGGDIKVDAGNGQNTGEGGTVKIRGGYSPNGNGGFIEIRGGSSNNGDGGPVNIYSGSSDNGIDGPINIVSQGTMNITSDKDMTITSTTGNMQFFMDGGMYIGPVDTGNQIVKKSDLNSYTTQTMIRYAPAFTATGLAFTGSGETHPTYNSYYTKSGAMVSFVIEVDCSTVTNFGTGQYALQLPFMPAVGFNHFTGWANVDTAVNPDVTNGHVILNVDHAGITDVLDLHYFKQAGGAHSPIVEGLFLQGTPVTLTTSSKIYVNGTYICQ